MIRNVKNIIARINTLENKKNVSCIMNYYNYLIDKGVATNTQGNNIQTVYHFARYLDKDNLTDIKEKHQVTTYLNTYIRNDDPDKKWISTWNIYMLRLVSFYRWLHNFDNREKQEEYWITPSFIKIKKKQS
jgi:integrase/recombinase XerD